MPNQPRADNPRRSIRIPDDLWTQVQWKAEQAESTASEVVRTALLRYFDR